MVTLYLDSIIKCIENEESAIDIWYVLVPNSVLSLCRPKSYSGKASFDKKRIEEFSMGQISLFPEEDEKLRNMYKCTNLTRIFTIN